jgi:hypothetical protein
MVAFEPESNVAPNPWKVTFDRTGNVFQMYGDGFVLDRAAAHLDPAGHCPTHSPMP